MKTMTNLERLHDKVVAAEKALLQARDELRAAVTRKGISRGGLFGDSQFVPRKTAERWAEEERRKGFESALEGMRVLMQAGCLRASGPAETCSAEALGDDAAEVLAQRRRRDFTLIRGKKGT